MAKKTKKPVKAKKPAAKVVKAPVVEQGAETAGQ